jgi:hypothetical protein
LEKGTHYTVFLIEDPLPLHMHQSEQSSKFPRPCMRVVRGITEGKNKYFVRTNLWCCILYLTIKEMMIHEAMIKRIQLEDEPKFTVEQGLLGFLRAAHSLHVEIFT